MLNYRYEVNENKVPDEIEKYAMQIAEDTVKIKIARRSVESFRRRLERIGGSTSSQHSRRDSVSSYVSSVIGGTVVESVGTPGTGRESPEADEKSETASVMSVSTNGWEVG